MTKNTEYAHSNNDFTFRQYLLGLFKHWFLILSLIILAIIATFLFFMNKTPSYTSVSSILLEDKASILTSETTVNVNNNVQNQADSQRKVSNEVQYLKSLEMAQKVNTIIRFDNIREFNNATKGKKIDNFTYFSSKLKVAGVPNSNVINISYTASDAKLAAKIVNVITGLYIQHKKSEKTVSNGSASNFLREKVNELQNKQRVIDAKIVDYRIKNGIFNGQNNQKLLSQQLSTLNNSIVAASSQRAEATARAKQIARLLSRNGNLDSARDVLNSRLIQQYRGQALAIERQIAVLSKTLLPTHPRMESINAELNNVLQQIRNEARNIMASLRGEAEIAQQRERSLKAELNKLKKQEAGSLLNEVGLNSLLRDSASNRVLLDSYSARFREADVRNKTNIQAPKVHILSPAVASLKQSGISRNNTFIIAIIAAFILGITIASMRILNNNNPNPKNKQVKNSNHATNIVKFNKNIAAKSKVSAIKEAEENKVGKNSANDAMKNNTNSKVAADSPKASDVATNIQTKTVANKITFRDLSFMAAIPSISVTSKRQAHVMKSNILTNLNTEYAEGFLDLADNLMAQTGAGFQKHFMISGLERNDDTYEAILNLGRILDHKGARILVLDLDKRNNIFPKSMAENCHFGFSDILGGQCYFEDSIVKDSRSGLHFLLAGTSNQNLNRVITSKDMHEFLTELDGIYDVILIHSSNLNQSHINDFIDGQIDLTLLVADWEDRATVKLQKILAKLKQEQASEFGLLLMDADLNEFNKVVN